jgi:hypothetical protein
MGKSLNDLQLSDAPLTAAKPVDPRSTDWYRFCREIDDLLATGRYTWAEDTLTGIQETVERLQRVSEGQRRAVATIEARGDAQPRRGSRRYEGFGGRRW